MLINSTYEHVTFCDTSFPVNVFDTTTYVSSLPVSNIVAHWHEHLEILWFIEGGSYVFVGEELFEAQDGDIFIVNPNDSHAVPTGKRAAKYWCFLINPSMLDGQGNDFFAETWKALSHHQISFRHRIASDQVLTELFSDFVKRYQEKADGYQLDLRSKLYAIYAELYRRFLIGSGNTPSRESEPSGFRRIVTYIAENYKNDIPLKILAELYGVTESYFCKLFKKQTGMTAAVYINKYRLSRAVQLLATTDLSVTEIATSVGFSSICYFSKCFKKTYLMTPMDFRQQATAGSFSYKYIQL